MSDTSQEWTDMEELYLQKLHKSSAVLEEYNRNQYVAHTEQAKRYAIPIVIISSVNSVFSVSAGQFIPQNFVSVASALLSLICGVLSSITMLLKIQEKINNYIIVCKEFQKLKYEIGKELSVNRDKRTCNGIETISKLFNDYQGTLDKMEIKGLRTIDYLLLDKLPKSIYLRSEKSSDDDSPKSKPKPSPIPLTIEIPHNESMESMTDAELEDIVGPLGQS
jgi:hypothetical protein